MSKKFSNRIGVVYSTNPDYHYQTDDELIEKTTAPADKQPLKLRLDNKKRNGKTVTLIEGFTGTTTDLETLAKQLKTKLGVGGSAEAGEILLQGDLRDKALTILQQLGYTKTKKI